MSERAPQEIRRMVERLARRIRTQRAIDGGITGLTVQAMVSMLALVLAKTSWIAFENFLVVFLVAGTIPLGLALLGWFRHLDVIGLAQRLDRTHGLHDRLSTALSLAERGAANEFERAQIQDAERFLNVDIKPAAPFSRPTDLFIFLGLAACLAMVAVLRAPSHDHPIPQPPHIKHEPVLDSATLEMEKNRLEQLRKELEGLQDPEAKALLDEIEELLEAVEEQSISEREFLEELERIEEEASEPTTQEETERLAEKLKEAAEELEKEAQDDLAKEPAAQELVDALKNKDLGAASKAMEKLAQKLADKDLSDKQVERIARILEKFADKIDPNNKALQKLLEKNQDLVDKLSKKFDQLSDNDKQRLKRAQEELAKQKQEQQKDAEKESSRQLKKLQRLSQEAAEDAKDVLKGGKGEREATEDREHDFENEAGRKSDGQKKAQEASEEMQKGGKQQQSQQAREMVKRQIQEMREAMKRGNSGKDGKNGKDEKKGEQMKEFLDRAKGMKAKVEQVQPTNQNGSGEREHKFHGGEGESKSGGEVDKPAEDESNFAGAGKGDRELGDETDLDSKRIDEKVDVDSGKGPSRSEIIKAASEEGFATTEYKDVYGDYEDVVEEVMEKEKIPAGYRYYIKRYFQLIQPQE